MPAITRVGDANTGHDACPPTTLASGSSNVFVEGKPAGRVGDPYVAHGCKDHPSHVGTIASGSANVFINKKPAARVGDPVSCGGCVAEGASKVSVGDGGNTQDVKLNTVCTVVSASPLLTDEDEIILATPDIASNMASKQSNPENALGWSELSRMLCFWLSGEGHVIKDVEIKDGTCKIFITSLDIDWGLKYSRFKKAYQDLVLNGLNENGQAQLVVYLKQTGVFETGGEFDFSTVAPEEREKWYYNHKKVSMWGDDSLVDGMTAALAGHTIRTLAKGFVKVNADGTRTVTVSNIFTYIHDLFNFEESKFLPELTDQLGFWSKEKLDFTIVTGVVSPSYKLLSNSLFREFRKNYGIGGDYEVLSNLHECKEFSQRIFLVEKTD